MLAVAIEDILAVLSALVPYLGLAGATTTAVENIVNLLTKLMPSLSTLSASMIQVVSNIIADLQQSGALSAAQQIAMVSFATQCDAAFDAASAAADAVDPTMQPVPTTPSS
jgi:hypothetical protein